MLKNDELERTAIQQLGKALNCILCTTDQGKFKTLAQCELLPTGTNIFIRGLPAYMTDDCLYRLAKCYGEIQSSKCIIDSKTQRCKGFGFVMFTHEEQALACIEGLKKLGLWTSLAKVQTNQQPQQILTPSSSSTSMMQDYFWGTTEEWKGLEFTRSSSANNLYFIFM